MKNGLPKTNVCLPPTCRRAVFTLAAVLISVLQGVALAGDAASDDPVPDVSAESGSYCGIYSVYAALHAYGKKVEFPELLKTKYIGDITGSSIKELALAVTDHGLKALPMTGLSRSNLISSQSPIILHVNTPDSPAHYTHWLLFLGMENGMARIVDAPHKPELIPLADVLARWDGVGLYVSDELPTPPQLKTESLITGENLALAAGLLVLMGLMHRSAKYRSEGTTVQRPNWQVAVIMLFAVCGLAALWHACAQDGFFRNAVAVRTVIQQHRPSFLPKLSIPELEQSLKIPGVVVIDARYPADFESGHVPGAINVPVFTTQVERRKLLADVPRGAKVIVYCQSEACQFDETLGAALYAEGIENVALFPGGYRQWGEKHAPSEESPEPQPNSGSSRHQQQESSQP